ncbi:MAG: RnfABCDGE type electron transport complex subunit D [Spirochaetia bacterium]|nr:RnfABCDGE type electron transport complex subunit D [Spirochaetia bacterium]
MNKKNDLNMKLQSKKINVRPFVYNRPSVSDVCIKVLVLLSLQVLSLLITGSFDSFFIVLVSFSGALLVSLLNTFVFKKEFYKSLTILIQGIVIGLLLPAGYPLVGTFCLSFIFLFFSRCLLFKHINSWINEGALAVVVSYFVGTHFFPDFLITTDLLCLRNPSTYMIQNNVFPIYEFDIAVTNFLNNTVFSLFKVTIPNGYVSMFIDTQSIIPAFRFNLLTILSSVILFSDKSFSGIIPFLFLVVYAVLIRFFSPLFFGGIIGQGDILLAFLTGGTLFCIVFMIQWYGTAPITIWGKISFGVISGILAFFIMGCGTSPIGMVYTVLIGNVVNMMIRFFEERQNHILLNSIVRKIKSAGENE